MLGIALNKAVRIIAKPVLKIAETLERKSSYAPGQACWNEIGFDMAKHFVSSDPLRREVQKILFLQNPQLACGGVTYGWLGEALKSISILQKRETAARITTPTMFAIAGKDRIVSNQGIARMARKMPHAETDLFEKALHQIHRETDVIRNRFLASFDGFVDNYLHQNLTP